MQNLLEQLKNKLIVSCQALENEPMHSAQMMARMAVAAEMGGAAGIRANSVEDIVAIKSQVKLPLIGLIKSQYVDSEVYITPTAKEIEALLSTGAELIALDATHRIRPGGGTLEDLFPPFRNAFQNQLFVADCATLEDALRAQDMGFDVVATTLLSYTKDTRGARLPGLCFIEKLVQHLDIPVIAEGGINTPEQAVAALEHGAHCCVVGSAITRPLEITKRFVSAMTQAKSSVTENRRVIAIDVGGTAIKHCLFHGNEAPESIQVGVTPTKAHLGGEHLIRETVSGIIRSYGPCDRIAICTCGVIDTLAGRVKYATDTIPGYTGMDVAGILEKQFHVSVMLENDTLAAAVGEAHYGVAKGKGGFLYLTFGTGIGGAIHMACMPHQEERTIAAAALGHIVTHVGGRKCNCGACGCYEQYAATSALVKNVECALGKTLTGEEIMKMKDDPAVAAILEDWIYEVVVGLASLVHVINPNTIVLGGGIMRNASIVERIKERIPSCLLPTFSNVSILGSTLENKAGVLGMLYLDGRRKR